MENNAITQLYRSIQFRILKFATPNLRYYFKSNCRMIFRDFMRIKNKKESEVKDFLQRMNEYKNMIERQSIIDSMYYKGVLRSVR